MSSKVKSLEDALKRKQAIKDEEGHVQQFSVTGDAPDRMPHAGESVEFTFSDPTMIGSPKFDLGMFVSKAYPETEDGRVNGWVLMDPGMQIMGPNGRPVQVPPLVPVGNVPYCREHKPMTWRYHGDKEVDA